MRVLSGVVIGCLAFALLSCLSGTFAQTRQQMRYLEKTPFDTVRGRYGQHIEIRERRPVQTEEVVFTSPVDDRDKIHQSGYSKKEKIGILQEYLSFQRDTTPSNKFYFFVKKGIGYKWMRPLHRENFTVEVEALFSFSLMLTMGATQLDPVLIDKRTQTPVNGDRAKMDEIYSLYRKWLKRAIKTDFKDMTLPLAGTPYYWKEDEEMKPISIKPL